MIIKSVRVQNFRSILDEELHCDSLTVLVGANGSGKSSLLRAIELFYAPDPTVAAEDFYAEDVSRDIEITITFADLSSAAAKRFAKYVESGSLTVARVISVHNGSASARFHGSTVQNPDFVGARTAGGKSDIRAKYNELRTQPPYTDLPTASSADKAHQAMEEWEAAHPETCVRTRDDGQFFGFKQVAQGYLGEFTRFIFIPAVRDAAEDAAEGRGTAISELMDLVVRSALARREELTQLRERVQAEYDAIVDPNKLTELGELGGRLTGTLRTYVPEATVDLAWIKTGAIELPPPKAQVKLIEDGFSASVARTGHGLQRAFILTLLQHLAVARSASREEQPEPSPDVAPSRALANLIIAIEEPELYQHPNRQRHIAKILLQLACGTIPGVAGRTQIVYATHSPLFVGTDRFDQIRLARKVAAPEARPKVTKLVWTTLNKVADRLWELSGQRGTPFTGDTLRARLQAIMTPWMNEGFFADIVVLVEGEDDRAAILGMVSFMGRDLEGDGFAVIPCMGKSNLDRPAAVFHELGIPTYIIWDGDEGENGARPEDNRYLLRLVGHAEEDWPQAVRERYACFKRNLEQTLRDEIGAELFDRLVSEVGTSLGISKRELALKNPVVLQQVITRANEVGQSSSTLRSIVDRIVALKSR